MRNFKKIIAISVLILLIISGVFWFYLNYDDDSINIDRKGLDHITSVEIAQKAIPEINTDHKNIILKDGNFYSPDGRSLFLRGINLGGSTKVPYTPNMGSHVREGFFDGVNISFVGRPFPLKEADEHFSRLKAWGFNFIRFLITWEAIEHKAPGIYDEEYLKYVRAVIQKAAEYDINVFIDPHQDLWSRYSGGDGAPLWTFEIAGMNVRNFKETDAAFVHNTHGDPYPKMVWFSNYFKLASATMFTLFYAGNDFAPHLKVNDSVPVQDFLQTHYINAIVQLAQQVKDLPNVVGFELINEPSSGYVGLEDISKPFETGVLGLAPTPWQGMLLGDGIPQKVKRYELGMTSLKDMGEELINQEKRSAWLNPSGDIWKQEGVWKMDQEGKPQLLIPDYFAKINGREVEFNKDYYIPFALKYEKALHDIDPEWMIFVENVLLPVTHELPDLKQFGDRNWVNASHWYDDATLVTKNYNPWIGFLNDEVILGKRNVRLAFEKNLSRMKDDTRQFYGTNAGTLLGEFGIPFDMNDGEAYRNGDFSQQAEALDRSVRVLEKNKLSYTLWNYTADNNNKRGDLWNGEDLSVFSVDQQTDKKDINSGGRALKAVIRPFPSKTAGNLLQYAFNMEEGELIIRFKPDPEMNLPTEIILPDFHYQKGFEVYSTPGNFSFDPDSKTLMFLPEDKNVEQTVIVKKKK